METTDLLKLAGQGGFALVVLGAFVWIVRTVGLQLVAAINRLGERFEEHTRTDVEHHTEVKLEIVSLRGEISGIAYERARTPVEGVPVAVSPREFSRPITSRPRTPVRGVPTEYSMTKRGRDE